MNVESLKNYGRPYSETLTALPRPVQGLIRDKGGKVIRKHLGLPGLLRLLFIAWRNKRRMLRVNLDPVRRRGLASEETIGFIIQNTALFAATARIAGVDRALAIHREIVDEIAGPMNKAILPSGSEIDRLGDPFTVFRQYLLAFLEAERKAGLHEYRIAEDSDRAIAADITYCAFCEIPRRLGIMEACESSCYSDEVFFPGFLKPLGLRFVRTTTIARGGELCDFRFERISAS